jgi:hypothetical protein
MQRHRINVHFKGHKGAVLMVKPEIDEDMDDDDDGEVSYKLFDDMSG